MCPKCDDTGAILVGTQSHPFGATHADEPLHGPCDCKAGLLQMGYTPEEADLELARIAAEQALAMFPALRGR